MISNLLTAIIDDNDNFTVQDTSTLIEGIIYYFTEINDKTIYRGKFKTTFDNEIKKII